MFGREPERARVCDKVDSVTAGRGALVLLVGEPGIGKTHLATHAAELAEQRGLRVAWGRCWETGGAPAFWPWSQVFESLDLADPFADAAGAVDAREGRFRRLEGAARALRDAAPLAIVLDDLHAADAPSLELLQIVARDLVRSPLLVVGTYRDVDAQLADVAARLAKIGREGDVIALPRLHDADVRAWIAADDPDAAIDAAEVCALAEGNPLFVREVLRAGRRVDARRLPVGLQAILDEQLARVDADVRALLACAAVLGRDFSAVEVSTLAELDADATAARLERARAAGIVEPSGRDRFAFVHALLRDRLDAALAPSRRIALHRRAGEMLLGSHLRRAAHHLVEGHDGGDPARVAEIARDASVAALDRFAFEEAARLTERALELAGIDDAIACELEVVRSESLSYTGDTERARASCRAAAERARRLGSASLLARAGLAAGTQLTSGRSDATMVELLQEALTALPETDDVLRARVMARLASALTPLTPENFEEGKALAREAIAMARRIADADSLRYVLAYSLPVHYYYISNDERRTIVDEAARAANEASPLHLDGFIGFNLRERGELARADLALDRLDAKLREVQIAEYAWRAPMVRATRAILAGDLDAAERLGLEARDIGARANVPIGAAFGLHRISLAQARGEPATIAQAGDVVASLARLTGPFAAWVLAATGRGAEARAILEQARFLPGVNPPLLLAADAAVLLGDTALAQRCYDAIVAQRSATVLFWGGPIGCAAIGPPARIAGGVAQLLGRLDDARALYDEAIAIADAMGAVPHAALARRARERLTTRGSPAPDRIAEAVLARSAEQWSLSFEGRTQALKSRRGLDYLAELLAQPRRDVHVLELSGGNDSDGKGAPLLDARAKAAYRERVEALRASIDEAEANCDLGRASRARAELDSVASELSRAIGLGGRDRSTATAADRARAAVTLAIRRAVDAIAAIEPTLGSHLDVAIKTGQFCAYEPDPHANLRWRITR